MYFRGENAFTVVVIYLFFTGVLYGHHSLKIDVTDKTRLHSNVVLEKDSGGIPQEIKGLTYYKKIVDSTQNSTLKLTALDSLIAKTTDALDQAYLVYVEQYVRLAIQKHQYNAAVDKCITYCKRSRDPDKVIALLLYTEPHLNKVSDTSLVLHFTNEKAYFYGSQGEFKKAVDIYTGLVTSPYIKEKDSAIIIDAFHQRGRIYMNLAEFDNAIKDITHAQKYYRRINDLDNIFYTQESLVTLYGEFGLEEKSIEEAKKVIAEKIRTNQTRYLCYNYFTLFISYFDLGDIKTAGEYAILALNTALEEVKTNPYVEIDRFYSLVATFYIYDDQLIKGKEYLDLAKEVSLKKGIDLSKNYDYQSNLSHYYLKSGRIQEAEKIALSLMNGFDGKLIENKIQEYLLLHLIYEAKNKHKKSLSYFRRYTQLKDSVYSVKKTNSLAYYQTIYETEKKEKDLAIQQSKIETQQTQQTYLIIGIGGLALVLLGAFSFIRKIISQKNQIEKEEQKVAESLVEKELLLKEIHHRVKNNLQIVYGLIHKQSRSSDDEKFKSLMEDSQNRIKSMAMIHQKLYQNNSFKEVDMKSYITELIEDIDATFKNKNQKIHAKIKMAVTKFHMDIAIPLGLILNELLTNTYKHAFNNREGNVFVSIEKKEGLHEIKVKDDGIGIPSDLEIENSGSLGMSLIVGLCKQMRATFNYENSNGSEFTIILNTNY